MEATHHLGSSAHHGQLAVSIEQLMLLCGSCWCPYVEGQEGCQPSKAMTHHSPTPLPLQREGRRLGDSTRKKQENGVRQGTSQRPWGHQLPSLQEEDLKRVLEH